ncbi:MAG TPA: class I SAM-dependent methyltransferase [Candidimonas sp.]|nr:class I SAM-dependent methyltransferase [Candidimonas sp.]
MNSTRNEKVVVCPLCEGHLHWEMPFFDQVSQSVVCRGHDYHWRACLSCGNGYPSSTPPLEELQQYWNKNRVEGVTAAEASAVAAQRLGYADSWAQKTWAFVTPHCKKRTGRFLDIACGLGSTVRRFQDGGWDAYGIDADPNTKAVHEKQGIKSTIGQFENIGTDKKFDLISIAHAIYFVTDPRTFVRTVRSSLAEGGLFLVVISDLTSTLSDGLPTQMHTWYPAAKALESVFSAEGLRIVRRHKVKGSVLMLFKKVDKATHQQRGAYFSAFALRSHRLRYLIVGKPLVTTVRTAKRIASRLF